MRLDSWTIHGGLNLHDAVSYGLANRPPLANAGPDQTVKDADRDGSETVTLDGSASSDRDGTIDLRMARRRDVDRDRGDGRRSRSPSARTRSRSR